MHYKHEPFLKERVLLLGLKPSDILIMKIICYRYNGWTLDNLQIVWSCTDDRSFKCLPYQLLMVVSWTTMVATGNGESGFDSGEGAWETATTSKEGSRRVNYPLPERGGSDEK
jgi:hypothetical protein